MATDTSPAVRARHLKNMLESIEKLSPAQSAAVLKGVDGADLATVRDSYPTGWIDIGTILRIDAAIAAAGDAAFLARFFRDFAVADYASGYLQPFVLAAVKIFGPSPGSFVKWVPRGWSTVLRNTGSVRAEGVTGHRARLVHADLPPILVSHRAWLDGHRAYFTGIFELAKTPGEVIIEEHDVARRRLVLSFRW